ncbi:MAG: 5'/3'-nucleotidase SurE, partial [Microcystis sp.]
MGTGKGLRVTFLTNLRAKSAAGWKSQAADFALTLVRKVTLNPFPVPTLLNVNVPPVSSAEIKGVKIT